MITVDGKSYQTVSDAARKLVVAVKTVREWVNRGVVPTPPKVSMGLRDIDIFPDEYITQMKQAIREYKLNKKKQRVL